MAPTGETKAGGSSNDKPDIKLSLLLSKREAMFEIVQKIFDLSCQSDDGATARERFLDESSQIDSLRTKYESIVDDYNTRLLQVNPSAKPDYNSLYAFETLYSRIKRTQARYATSELSAESTHLRNATLLKAKPKLAPIQIIEFNGDIKSWQMFYMTFKSVVHDNPSLTNAEKLYYLLPKLSEKARTAIAGISPCADNYELILQTLINKFEDKRMLVSAYLNQIFDFKGFQAASAVSFELFNDQFASAVSALKNLNLDNNQLIDLILLHIAMKKIDSETVRAFESKFGKSIPSFDEFVDFIATRAKVFERTSPSVRSYNQNKNNKQSNNSSSSSAPKYQAYVSTIDKPANNKCLCANVAHSHLFKCSSFNKMNSQERFKCVKDNNACVRCLSLSHKMSNCPTKANCGICSKLHHRSLHFDQTNYTPSAVQLREPVAARARAGLAHVGTVPTCAPVTSSHCACVAGERPRVVADIQPKTTATAATNVADPSLSVLVNNTATHKDQNTTELLPTAQVIVYDRYGFKQTIRALLDPASQSHFITKRCCDRLGIELNNSQRTSVSGFGGIKKTVQMSPINLRFYSRFDNNVSYNISPLVVDDITDLLPTIAVDNSALRRFTGLPVADENFSVPGDIDLLIGSKLFRRLLLSDDAYTSPDMPDPGALRTVLGYVFVGTAPAKQPATAQSNLTCCVVREHPAIDSLVRRFWELEELPSAPIQHPADIECEDFYASTTTRDPLSGRYVVGLPFKDDVYSLGNSMDVARKRFMYLERKLDASSTLRSAYNDVIRDYLDKGYVSLAPSYNPREPAPIYVIPHHGVVREDKTSTKLRIVLDASCRSSSGRSLNDLLHPGPNLQGDLFKIILRFRLHAVAMTADCRQQFLQIIMRETDRRYQCFLYRFNSEDPLMLYQFNRVCFGLSSSPYHALRTVRQLVDDDGAKYPLASSIVLSSLYMDDVAFSIPSEREAIAASQQMIDLFKGAQWDLVKWNSNSSTVLDNLPDSHKLPTEVEFDKTMQHKILGLHWSTEDDAFYYKISTSDETKCTKRSILSTVARLWDIMGFVAPTIVYAKILIKMLWQLNLDWDSLAPPHIIKMWRQFCDELPALNKLRIPRHVGVTEDCEVTLFGLSDASEAAYGAVVYLHVSSPTGNVVRLVCAKSKVSPSKPKHSIARLELLGGVLLAKLLRIVLDNYSERIQIKETYAFLDSKVALYWIKSSPHRWQTFVANRVIQITENIPPEKFFHCPGIENSADVLSRGVTPEKLVSHPLWLHGPPWVSLHPSQWPLRSLDGQPIQDMPEQRTSTHIVCASVEQCALHDIALRTSSWSKLLRIIVYICRFTKILSRRSSIAVTADDFNLAETKMLRALQKQHFSEEYANIKMNKPCSPAFNRLRPFIDNDDLIRVGGRLVNSGLDFTKIHPVILPRNGHVVEMIIDYYHIKNLHAGPELLMSVLRQRYWILSARRIVRQRVHKCNTCFRQRPRPTYPLMADLPDVRTRPATKAFAFVSCDYAGPISYVPVRRRGVHAEKAYLAVFSCMKTRATHIEVTTSLSTPSFLAAFKRFLSRRGPVQELHTDNATNFRGSASYLRDLYNFLRDEYYPKLEQECAENRIIWKFICPNSPHFGGSWESMIKVTKTILFKVIGQQLLSYEELCTVLTQVESVLNSRPLTALSSDPAEPLALTPSHFIHTAPLLSLPAPDVSSDNINLLDRYALMDKMVQSFWNRWRMEYLHGLQVRQKWNTHSVPISPGTVVVVINDNAPTLAWPLAVVEKVHPSKDGVIRVATVRIAGRTYLRPVVRLCPLPTQ